MAVSPKNVYADTGLSFGTWLLPSDCAERFTQFLTPEELAAAERVAKTWHKMACNANQYVWKLQGELQNVPKPECETGNGCKLFFSRVIRGNLRLAPLYQTVVLKSKGPGVLSQLEWSHPEPEYFVKIQVHSEESQNACRENHGPRAVDCPNLCDQESWQDIHPRVENFPSWLPLRFFFHKDGNYKGTGDLIRLQFGDQYILLTYTDPAKALEYRIKHANNNNLRANWLQSRAIAPDPLEWVHTKL